jgi:hypothetical protein
VHFEPGFLGRTDLPFRIGEPFGLEIDDPEVVVGFAFGSEAIAALYSRSASASFSALKYALPSASDLSQARDSSQTHELKKTPPVNNRRGE